MRAISHVAKFDLAESIVAFLHIDVDVVRFEIFVYDQLSYVVVSRRQ